MDLLMQMIYIRKYIVNIHIVFFSPVFLNAAIPIVAVLTVSANTHST